MMSDSAADIWNCSWTDDETNPFDEISTFGSIVPQNMEISKFIVTEESKPTVEVVHSENPKEWFDAVKGKNRVIRKKKEPYDCDEIRCEKHENCYYMFRPGNTTQHFRKHIEGNFCENTEIRKCKTCGRHLKDSKAMYTHCKSGTQCGQNKGVENILWVCPCTNCREEYVSEDALSRHVYTKHDKRCYLCREIIPSYQSLENHIKELQNIVSRKRKLAAQKKRFYELKSIEISSSSCQSRSTRSTSNCESKRTFMDDGTLTSSIKQHPQTQHQQEHRLQEHRLQEHAFDSYTFSAKTKKNLNRNKRRLNRIEQNFSDDESSSNKEQKIIAKNHTKMGTENIAEIEADVITNIGTENVVKMDVETHQSVEKFNFVELPPPPAHVMQLSVQDMNTSAQETFLDSNSFFSSPFGLKSPPLSPLFFTQMFLSPQSYDSTSPKLLLELEEPTLNPLKGCLSPHSIDDVSQFDVSERSLSFYRSMN